MERLEREHPEGELVEVLVCGAVKEREQTFYVYRSSEEMFHRQTGLVRAIRLAMENNDTRGFGDDGEQDEQGPDER
jgi:hypothetical protein